MLIAKSAGQLGWHEADFLGRKTLFLSASDEAHLPVKVIATLHAVAPTSNTKRWLERL